MFHYPYGISLSYSGGRAHGGEIGGSECEPEASVPHRLPAIHHDSLRASSALRYGRP